jgi:hypothetical protein
MRLSAVAAAAIGFAVGIAGAAQWHSMRDLFSEYYPSDFIKRHVLNLCSSYDFSFNRFNVTTRDECYESMPKGTPGKAHARIGLAANQLDLRQAADLHGVPSNDIRVIERTEAVRGGTSR